MFLVLSCIMPAAIAEETFTASGRQTTIPYTIKFPENGGLDKGLMFKVPVPGIVTKAQMTFDATNASYLPVSKSYDYTQTLRSHDAWKGNMSDLAPNKGPDSFQMTKATAIEKTNMTTSNTKYFTSKYSSNGNSYNYIYEHLSFDIRDSMNVIDTVKLTWEGYGIVPKTITDGCGVNIYLYNPGNSSWGYLTGYTEICNDGNQVDKTLVQSQNLNFMNPYELTLPNIDILIVTGFSGPEYQVNGQLRIETDFVKLDVTSHTDCNPHWVGVDVGLDGKVEHLYDRTVKGLKTFGDPEGFRNAVQILINGTQITGPDQTKDIQIAFNSTSGGSITVRSLDVVVDRPPLVKTVIGPHSVLEDTPVRNLLDLRPFFYDDTAGSKLMFEVSSGVNNPNIGLAITDDFYLSVTSIAPNWSGSAKVRIKATDALGQATLSNEFYLNVTAVNDLPVLRSIPVLTAYEDSPFRYNVSATDADNDPLLFTDDTELFVIEPSTGAIAFTPTQDLVGNYSFEITVTDANATIDKQQVVLAVKPTNDKPSVTLLLPTSGFEIQSKSVDLAWVGKDLDLDDLKYDLFVDSGAGLSLKAGDLSEAQYTLTGLEDGKRYRWTVEAKDAVSRSDRPPAFEFTVKLDGTGGGGGGGNNTTANQPPTASLLSPAKGSVIGTLVPTLTWKGNDPDNDPVTYKVIVYSSENVEFGRYSTNTTYLSIPSSLENNNRYLWTVIPNDGKIDGACLSGIWFFTTNRTSSVESQPPVIDIDVSPMMNIDENGSVLFDATGSSDPDGTITLYIWSFGDGTTLTGPQYKSVNHTFAKGGVFNVSLVIFDNDGKSDIWSYKQTVNSKTIEPKPKPPAKFFGLDQMQLLLLLFVIIVLVVVGTAGAFIAHRKLKYETYKVDQVFLVYQDGRLIKQASGGKTRSDTDGGEVLGGMLTAVQDFVKDSLNDTGGKSSLKVLEYGEQKIVIERGSKTFLAAFISGNVTEKLRGQMKKVIEELETVNKKTLSGWDGDIASIKNVDALDGLLRKD